ncbi:MAG: NAD(P)/FAD-dependent oxidoreductase [Clostridia bacterium]|nr:NAD(P)/FAD-dependent oxidoreductase [Clostridia bacterium]
MDKRRVAVIGGGAAGMMAAITAAGEGKEVTLFEKNKMLGRKLLITGKGRCNVTNDCEPEELIKNVATNPRFLYSAFYGFDSHKTMEYFESRGVKLKTERGRRVFPESDRSADIVNALRKNINELNINIINDTVVSVDFDKTVCCKGKSYRFDSVIIATGGKSYPLTGSTGDGYRFATSLGHSVTPLTPALVPVNTKEKWVRDLSGLSLKNVDLVCCQGGKRIFSERGEMLFTHTGVSGPLVLSLSSVLDPKRLDEAELTIDLKPALDEKTLENRIMREIEAEKNREIKNVLRKLLPQTLIVPVLTLSAVNGEKKANSVTVSERQALVKILKGIKLTVKELGGFDEAVITSGGVSVREIDPKTMQSKIVKDLYFAGEIIDVDAYTGGYNLQIAFSTGYLAGKNA